MIDDEECEKACCITCMAIRPGARKVIKEKPKTSSAPKSDVIDVKSELKKFKEMLDDGLIEKDDYDAKKKKYWGYSSKFHF